MAANIKLIYLVVMVLLATIVIIPVQLLGNRFIPSLARKTPVYWHKFVLFLLGVRVHVHGEISKNKPLMIISNHVSWSDILILGSISELCFIAKDEVKTWPGISWLSRLQRTVFVNRERKRDAGVQADTIAARLINGDTMVLFAEGTTGNGNKLLPFKSALFGAPQMALEQAEMDTIFIQPVAIAYNTLHGMPLGRYHQNYASWPGDVELVPHLKNFLKQGAFDVDVGIGEPLSFTKQTKRKEIAHQSFEIVRNNFSALRRLYHRN